LKTPRNFRKPWRRFCQHNYRNLVTAKMAKVERKKKVFINWSRTTASKTMVCVYSLRAREKPFVSCPLSWEELENLARRGAPEKLKVLHSAAISRVEKRATSSARCSSKSRSSLMYDLG